MTSAPLPLAQPATLKANLLCMLSMLIWAAGLPAADFLIGPVPPLPLTAARMSLAALVLLPIWWALEGTRVLARADWGRGLLIGGGGYGLGAFLIVIAQARTDAVTVAVISAMMPVVGITLECLLDGRRLRATLVLGVGLSLAGGLLAYGGRMGELGFGLGALAALTSVLLYTAASRSTVKAFPSLTPLGRATITLVGAALATTTAALLNAALGGAGPDWSALGAREALALAIYGIGALAISQVLWIASVGHLGIAVASLHGNASPFYVMIFLTLLGGTWGWMQALAALIVGAGVLIAQSQPRRRRA